MQDYYMRARELFSATRKQEVLAVIFFAVSFAVFALLYAAFTDSLASATGISLLLALTLVWLCVFSFSLALQKAPLALLSYGLAVAVAAVFFMHSYTGIIGVLILSIGFLEAHRRTQDERALLLKFRVVRIIRRGLPIFLTALAAFVAIGYVGIALVDDFSGDIHIPRPLFNALYTPVEKTLEAAIPGYSPEFSVEKTQALFLQQLFVPEALERFGIARLLEASSGSSLPLKEAAYEALNDAASNAARPYQRALPFVAFIGFFFAFRIIFVLLMWVSLGISALVMKLLLLYNIVSVKETSVQREQAALL